ncbi:VOC family protein [Granulosicoccus sp.]|nr:VOC family protein [Granulosicoccus sp.]MDB4223162.1 VOC family protein [Granulosicoccus sp.]
MNQHIALTTLVVKDYDEAIEFYTQQLGFELIEDAHLGELSSDGQPKRWVVVAPRQSQSRLLLARASTEEEQSRVGNQSGGRVFMFLHTDDFWRDHRVFSEKGVRFVHGEPRSEPYGTVAVFADLYGNLWDLIEPAS